MSLVINVNIADKSYPLKIDKEEDEERIRKAAKLINDRVWQYRQRFADKDTQDVLAMASLQFVVKLLSLETKLHASDTTEKLQAIDRMLEDYLVQEA
ncbi:MAG: cell division protein ZapA [Bacteroidales bacterium]|nr:cell division protein ZapA [Bacteroidales bacterium]MCR5715105.1 cell division protein ZapA [Bacteroidales bacterium]